MGLRCHSALLIAALAVLPCTRAQTNRQPAPDQPATTTAAKFCGGGKTYDQLTDPWRNPTGPQSFPVGTAPVELTLQTVRYNDRPVTLAEASKPNFCLWNSTYIGARISTTGEVFGFADDATEAGGGFGKMPAEAFAQLEALLDNLPDDFHRVPRPDRRLLVIVQRHGATTVRLYDTARLPDSIAKMIRLTGVDIPIILPTLVADRPMLPEEVNGLGLKSPRERFDFLTVSPDGAIGVVHDFSTKTLTVYEGGNWQSGGLPRGGRVVRTIEETWQPPVYGGYWVDTAFTPDARYLLVTWGGHVGAMFYDAKTWEPVTDANVFPQHLKEYLPSADWAVGVAVTESREALIWDARTHRIVSKLPGLGTLREPRKVWDRDGKQVYTTPLATIDAAVFSPDDLRVAIASSPSSGQQFGVWDVQTGEKLLDLPVVNVGQPLWWNDGRWLLAPYDSNRTEGIWDADTGRLVGTIDLTGCLALERNVADGDKLIQPCAATRDEGPKVMEWSVEGVKRQMEAFAEDAGAGDGQ